MGVGGSRSNGGSRGHDCSIVGIGSRGSVGLVVVVAVKAELDVEVVVV